MRDCEQAPKCTHVSSDRRLPSIKYNWNPADAVPKLINHHTAGRVAGPLPARVHTTCTTVDAAVDDDEFECDKCERARWYTRKVHTILWSVLFTNAINCSGHGFTRGVAQAFVFYFCSPEPLTIEGLMSYAVVLLQQESALTFQKSSNNSVSCF